MKRNVEALKSEIEALPTVGKLRLAADLLENGKLDLAAAIADRAVVEMASDKMEQLKQRLAVKP